MTLDCAGPGDDRQFVSPDRRVANAHDGLLGSQIQTDKLVRLADTNRFRDTWQILKAGGIDRSRVTRDADGRARRTRHRVRLESEFLNDVTHMRNLRIRGVGFHYD